MIWPLKTAIYLPNNTLSRSGAENFPDTSSNRPVPVLIQVMVFLTTLRAIATLTAILLFWLVHHPGDSDANALIAMGYTETPTLYGRGTVTFVKQIPKRGGTLVARDTAQAL